MQKEAAYTYVSNCPPFAVDTPLQARVCNNNTLCPFCRGRHLIAMFMKLELAMYGSREGKELLDPAVQIVQFRTLRHLGAYQKPWTKEAIRSHMQVANWYRIATLRTEIKQLDRPLGTIRMDFWPDLKQQAIAVQRKGVFLVRGSPEKWLEGYLKYPGARAQILPATRANLARAFVGALGYPPQLMNADADWLVPMLKAMKNIKQSIWVGNKLSKRKEEG